MVDGTDRDIARTGFALALVDENGELIAYGLGMPPAWIDTAPSAEAWAYFAVLQACPFTPFVVTDCLAVRLTLASGASVACGASKPLARIWTMIFHALDGTALETALERLVWMPSHKTLVASSLCLKSDGAPVSATDWRSNRLVDGLAKRAADCCRTHQDLRGYLHHAKTMVEHSAAIIGMAAYGANNYSVTVWSPQGKLVDATRRDSSPPPVLRGNWGKRPATDQSSQPAAADPGPDPPRQASADLAAEEHAARLLAHANAARARGTEAAQTEEARKELRFRAAWRHDLRDRRLQPAAGPSATERLAALRQRLAQRRRDADTDAL